MEYLKIFPRMIKLEQVNAGWEVIRVCSTLTNVIRMYSNFKYLRHDLRHLKVMEISSNVSNVIGISSNLAIVIYTSHQKYLWILLVKGPIHIKHCLMG